MARPSRPFATPVVLTLLIAALVSGCGERADVAPVEQEQGNTAVGIILDQATRLEGQRAEMTAVADALADGAQRLRGEADDLERQAQDMRFRADQLEAQAAALRDISEEHGRAIGGLRNSATTVRSILNNEPIEPPTAEPVSRRGEFLLYGAIVLVLVVLLWRVRRQRMERQEEERLDAIRRQQAAYSPVAPEPAAAPGGEARGEAADAPASESDEPAKN